MKKLVDTTVRVQHKPRKLEAVAHKDIWSCVLEVLNQQPVSRTKYVELALICNELNERFLTQFHVMTMGDLCYIIKNPKVE